MALRSVKSELLIKCNFTPQTLNVQIFILQTTLIKIKMLANVITFLGTPGI